MANFMGPMAPPQAAPQAPQSLEFQTDPNQRQKFRQFMRDRMRPPMPQMPAPMPQPMPTVPAGSYIYPDIDIFGPQPYAAGGVVGGLNDLQKMSGQMVEALNQVVYGGAPSGGGMASAPAPTTYNGNRPILGDPTQPSYGTETASFDGLFELPTIFNSSSSPFEMRIDPIRGEEGGSRTYDTSDPFSKFNNPYGFERGGSVDDALADALSNDVGDYAVDDTMTDLSQTSWDDNSGDSGDVFQGESMRDYQGDAVSKVSQGIGQSIQDAINASRTYGAPAPVGQSSIFAKDVLAPQVDPESFNTGVFGMSRSLGGKSATVDLLGNPFTIGFEDGGDVPRRTEIRGQDHMLSYITPDEADILKALGGTGEMHNGIPSFAEADGDDDQTGGSPSSGATSGEEDNAGGASDDGGSFSGGNDPSDSNDNWDGDFEINTNVPADMKDDIADMFSEEDYSTGQDFNTLGDVYNMTAINRGREIARQLAENAANMQENEIETGSQTPIQEDLGTGSRLAQGEQQGFFDTDLMDELGIASSAPTKSSNTMLGEDLLSMNYETDYPDKSYVGGAPVGPRFGTATGPGRLSSVTPEEMEALRTGNMVQRQMYRQLAGQKAFSNLANFDPNNVEKGIFDSLLDMTTKPSSAIEVFRTPITEQVGFKSVPTGTFKEGISGVTGMGNTPGVMGGLMQMFGVDPIVYTGDNTLDPNFVDSGGSSDDDVILPLEPRVDPIREETDPDMIGGITNGMYVPPAPQPVVVPSTRTGVPTNLQMPVGYGTPQTGQINPYSLAEIQRYQQMLARLGQGSPIPFADGGAVLDAAAGKFLEALTAA